VNLPNAISIGRFLTVPVMIWLIAVEQYAVGFWLFVAAGVSDAVDGFIAKRFDRQTAIGAYLDPIADKALLMAVYVMLGLNDAVPDWLVILVVFRDLSIGGGMLLLIGLTGPRRIVPLRVSKLNTVVQILLAAVALGDLAIVPVPAAIMDGLIYATAATTVASGLAYGRLLIGVGADLENLP
jgi:cardiolipin synthase